MGVARGREFPEAFPPFFYMFVYALVCTYGCVRRTSAKFQWQNTRHLISKVTRVRPQMACTDTTGKMQTSLPFESILLAISSTQETLPTHFVFRALLDTDGVHRPPLMPMSPRFGGKRDLVYADVRTFRWPAVTTGTCFLLAGVAPPHTAITTIPGVVQAVLCLRRTFGWRKARS